MDNLEKEKASDVFKTTWDIMRRYGFIPLDDFLWERFIEECANAEMKYKQDEPIWKLYRGVILGMTEYKEAIEHADKKANSTD